MKSFSIFIFCLSATLAFAASESSKSSKLQPLYFQADKNGVKVLPQKFEYGLLDAEKIRIGDILIDATTFNFQLKSSRGDGGYAFKLTWPAGLLTEGTLSVLNNNGKAIWSANVGKGDIKVVPLQSNTPNLRSEVAEYTSGAIAPEILDQFKILPFMTFCISHRDSGTKVYLCSRELYMASEGKELTIKDRLTTKRTAKVQINGKSLGNQGTIILNDRNENIFFRASAESSAYLEIDTRMNDVDFKDVVLDREKEVLIITASGAEPATKDQVKVLGNELWQAQLPMDFPVIYLKGDGGIPMRQEFFVVGHVPEESFRPFVTSDSPKQTFSSSITLKAVQANGTKVKPTNTQDTLRFVNKNRFDWTLHGLESGTLNKRFLEVETNNKKFYVRYDILRGSPYFFRGSLYYDSPSGVAFGQAEFKWWLENIISPFSSALEFELNQHLTKKDGYPEYDDYRISYLYKFTPGSYMEDETWGLGIPFSMIKGKDFSIMSPGLKLWGLRKPLSFFPGWIQWYYPYLTFLAGGSAADVKMKGGLELGTVFYTQMKEKNYLTYGLRYLSYTFDPSFQEEKGQFGLNVGYAWKF